MKKFEPPRRVRRITVRVRDSSDGLRRMQESSDRCYDAGLKFYESLKGGKRRKCQSVQSVVLIWITRAMIIAAIAIYAMSVVVIAKMIV